MKIRNKYDSINTIFFIILYVMKVGNKLGCRTIPRIFCFPNNIFTEKFIKFYTNISAGKKLIFWGNCAATNKLRINQVYNIFGICWENRTHYTNGQWMFWKHCQSEKNYNYLYLRLN